MALYRAKEDGADLCFSATKMRVVEGGCILELDLRRALANEGNSNCSTFLQFTSHPVHLLPVFQ